MQQIQSRNMIVRVQTVDGRRIFLDGWTLNALGKRSMVQGSNDQIYELTMDELKEIITAYRRRNPEISITAEGQHINSLDNLYSKSQNNMMDIETMEDILLNAHDYVNLDGELPDVGGMSL